MSSETAFTALKSEIDLGTLVDVTFVSIERKNLVPEKVSRAYQGYVTEIREAVVILGSSKVDTAVRAILTEHNVVRYTILKKD